MSTQTLRCPSDVPRADDVEVADAVNAPKAVCRQRKLPEKRVNHVRRANLETFVKHASRVKCASQENLARHVNRVNHVSRLALPDRRANPARSKATWKPKRVQSERGASHAKAGLSANLDHAPRVKLVAMQSRPRTTWIIKSTAAWQPNWKMMAPEPIVIPRFQLGLTHSKRSSTRIWKTIVDPIIAAVAQEVVPEVTVVHLDATDVV